MRNYAKPLSVALILLMFSGCGITLPDLKPFAEKTSEMVTGIGSGYTLTEEALLQTEGGKEYVTTLKERWALTDKALKAVVAYSDALAAVADAGTKGSESTTALINSLQGLSTAVSAFGLPIPAVSNNITSAVVLIGGVIAKLRARKALKEAVMEAKSAINEISVVLFANFKELKNLNESASIELLRVWAVEHDKLVAYHTSLVKENDRIGTILTAILDYFDPTPLGVGMRPTNLQRLKKEDLDLATTIDAGPMSDKAIADLIVKRQEHWTSRAVYIRKELDRIAPDYAAYTARKDEIQKKMNASGVILEKSSTAIQTWAKTHRDLDAALASKQRVTVLELAAIVKEIADVYQKGVS